MQNVDFLEKLSPQARAALLMRHKGYSGIPKMPLRQFVREAWHVVEPSTVYQHNWHIDAIADHLQACSTGQIQNLIINIQPRHMKSLLVSVFWPVWTWTFYPSSQWLFIAHKQQLATRDNRKRKLIIKSPWYQQNFGHIFKLSGDQRQKSNFENDKRGHMIAAGLSGIVGLSADFIVGDDVLSNEGAFSEASRYKANETWDQAVNTRLNDPKRGVKVMICQRLHEDDPVGHLTRSELQGGMAYEKLIIPTEYEPNSDYGPTSIGWTDPRTEPGELLWPERYDRQYIDTLKRSLGSVAASAQLQQRPTVAGGSILSAHWWQYWQFPGQDLGPVVMRLADGSITTKDPVQVPNEFRAMAQSWDMSFKDGGGSYVVGQVWGIMKGRFFLVDQVRERMDLPRTLLAVKNFHHRYPRAIAKLIEDKANGPAVIQSLKHAVAGIIPITPKGSKEARAAGIAPLVESGSVYLPHPEIAPWVFDFIDEASSFPVGVNDDQIDCLSQMLEYVNARKRKSRAISRGNSSPRRTRRMKLTNGR